MAHLLQLILAPLVAAHAASARPLIVHAAASLSEAIVAAAEEHERRTGVEVVVNAAASSTLARQVQAGAPGDVVLTADEATMDELEKLGLLVAATRRSVLSNTLVVVVAHDCPLRLRDSRDLASPAVASVALAEPASVPAGRYAVEHLRRAGAWAAVREKVLPAESVRGALAAVEAGHADAAIVYATDARASSKVRVACGVPREQAPEISYPAAVLAESEDVERAAAFLRFLSSTEGLAVFEAHGFLVRR